MFGRTNSVSRRVDYRDTVDLPARLSKTLAVMKSARSKDRLMAIWESDISAVEDALTDLKALVAERDAALERSRRDREYCAAQTGSDVSLVNQVLAANARCSSQAEQPQ